MNTRGNALFLILIAVALFAALSYAVTNSGRGGSGIDDEKAGLLASEALQWFATVQHEFTRMQMLDNIQIDGFDFNPPAHGRATRCSSDDCRFFENLGGPARLFSIADPAFYQNGEGSCTGVPTYGDGPQSHAMASVRRIEGLGRNDLGDVYISIECVSQDVCRAINRLNGISNPSSIPSDPSNRHEYNFSGIADGDFPEPATGTNSNVGDEDTRLRGKSIFCHFNGSHGGTRTELVMVLAAR